MSFVEFVSNLGLQKVNYGPVGALVKVLFQTFGCKVNQVETELLREQVLSGGWQPVNEAGLADVCVINSCSVTAEADRKCRQFIRRVQRENPHAQVVVTGCYATRAPEELKTQFPGVRVVSNQEKGQLFGCLGLLEVERLASQSVRHFSDHTRAFVKVQDGCRSTCTYCIIPSTRPDLWFKPVLEVVEEVRRLVEHGYQEVVLSGIRLGRYLSPDSSGERVNLAGLASRLCALPGNFRLRLSSLEITELSDSLIELMTVEPKLCHHLHIPLQGGHDDTLKRMGRWYNTAYYQERLRQLRSRVPDVSVFADVIVGFPGETEADFQASLKFIEDLKLSGLHVFSFSARPGTKAHEFPGQHDNSVIAQRSRRMHELDKRLRERFARRFLGTVQEVLLEESSHPLSGWTSHYVRVNLPEGSSAQGLVPVELVGWSEGASSGQLLLDQKISTIIGL